MINGASKIRSPGWRCLGTNSHRGFVVLLGTAPSREVVQVSKLGWAAFRERRNELVAVEELPEHELQQKKEEEKRKAGIETA